MRVGNHMVFVLIRCTDNMDTLFQNRTEHFFPFVLVFVSINLCFKVQLNFWSRSDGSIIFSKNLVANAGIHCRDS